MPITKSNVDQTLELSKKFVVAIKTAKAALGAEMELWPKKSKYTAAIKRISMDLSRSLADLRARSEGVQK